MRRDSLMWPVMLVALAFMAWGYQWGSGVARGDAMASLREITLAQVDLKVADGAVEAAESLADAILAAVDTRNKVNEELVQGLLLELSENTRKQLDVRDAQVRRMEDMLKVARIDWEAQEARALKVFESEDVVMANWRKEHATASKMIDDRFEILDGVLTALTDTANALLEHGK